jgi:predicted GTPase
MNKLIVPAVVIAVGMAATAAWSQAPAPNPNVKIYYTTQAGASPPTFVLFTNQTKPLHFSYERFLENQLRARYPAVKLELTGELPLNFDIRKASADDVRHADQTPRDLQTFRMPHVE